MKIEEPNNMLIIEKQYLILSAINSNGRIKNMYQIAKEKSITYTHVIKTIERFRRINLVRTNKSGRNRFVTLTDEGVTILKHLEKIRKITGFIPLKRLRDTNHLYF